MVGGIDVAIVGAGPYGLSIAAHLGELGIDFRIFGVPMHNWLRHMPKRMLLKSEGFASSLYDPHGRFPLRQYCAEQGIGYADLGLPVPLEVFTAYGLEFHRRFVPCVESKTVLSLKKLSDRFLLSLDNEEEVVARNVVIATGFSYLYHIPEELADLPKELLTHSAEHSNLEEFKDRHITVIGAGASAIDLATLLHEGGAEVTLVSRKPHIEIDTKMRLPRPLLDRLRRPATGAGLSWRSVIYADAPQIFRLMPAKLRLRIVKRHLGPTGGYFMRERFSHVRYLAGYHPVQSAICGGQARIRFEAGDGTVRQIVSDHVIAATGFRVNLRRLPFLTGEILAQLKLIEQTPALSSTFQSSIPGLYFVGLSSASSFGPIMRFAYGARFTAPRLAGALVESLVRKRKAR